LVQEFLCNSIFYSLLVSFPLDFQSQYAVYREIVWMLWIFRKPISTHYVYLFVFFWGLFTHWIRLNYLCMYAQCSLEWVLYRWGLTVSWPTVVYENSWCDEMCSKSLEFLHAFFYVELNECVYLSIAFFSWSSFQFSYNVDTQRGWDEIKRK